MSTLNNFKPDFEFICTDGTVGAHAAVLAFHSKQLEIMIYSDDFQRQESIEIDEPTEFVQAFVAFIYTPVSCANSQVPFEFKQWTQFILYADYFGFEAHLDCLAQSITESKALVIPALNNDRLRQIILPKLECDDVTEMLTRSIMNWPKSKNNDRNKAIIDLRPDVINLFNYAGNTPVFCACMGNLEMVKHLVARGADLHILTLRFKETVVHAACHYPDILDYLLEVGFDAMKIKIPYDARKDVWKSLWTKCLPSVMLQLRSLGVPLVGNLFYEKILDVFYEKDTAPAVKRKCLEFIDHLIACNHPIESDAAKREVNELMHRRGLPKPFHEPPFNNYDFDNYDFDRLDQKVSRIARDRHSHDFGWLVQALATDDVETFSKLFKDSVDHNLFMSQIYAGRTIRKSLDTGKFVLFEKGNLMTITVVPIDRCAQLWRQYKEKYGIEEIVYTTDVRYRYTNARLVDSTSRNAFELELEMIERIEVDITLPDSN